MREGGDDLGMKSRARKHGPSIRKSLSGMKTFREASLLGHHGHSIMTRVCKTEPNTLPIRAWAQSIVGNTGEGSRVGETVPGRQLSGTSWRHLSRRKKILQGG